MKTSRIRTFLNKEQKMGNVQHVAELYNRLAGKYDERWQGYLKSTNDVAFCLTNPTISDRVLDASGGTGLLAEQIAKTNGGIEIVLIDISEGMLEMTRNKMKEEKLIHIVRGDVHELPFKNEYFTKVLCINSLHHYYDPGKALSEFHRVLMPNGSITMVDWRRDPVYFALFDFLMKINPTHSKSYKTDEILALLAEAGFEAEKKVEWNYRLWPLVGIKAAKVS